MKKPFNTFITTSNSERSGSRFAVKIQEGKPVIQLELFHDTVAGLKAVSVGFELLGGTTTDQANTMVKAMNETIVGVMVTPK
jgi:hypothetical protein